MSRMTCLSFVFSSKPPRRTSLQINSEMTWLSFSFHYKRLNLYFTIKLVFEIRTSHYIHALAFHAKRSTSQVTLPPVVQACWQRTEVGWQYGQIRINILTAKVLTSNIMFLYSFWWKFHNRLGSFDENSTIARRLSRHQSRCFRLCVITCWCYYLSFLFYYFYEWQLVFSFYSCTILAVLSWFYGLL